MNCVARVRRPSKTPSNRYVAIQTKKSDPNPLLPLSVCCGESGGGGATHTPLCLCVQVGVVITNRQRLAYIEVCSRCVGLGRARARVCVCVGGGRAEGCGQRQHAGTHDEDASPHVLMFSLAARFPSWGGVKPGWMGWRGRRRCTRVQLQRLCED